MSRRIMRTLLLAGVMFGMLLVSNQANAWWGYSGCGPTYCTYSYACYRPCYWRGRGLLGRLFGGWRAYPGWRWDCYEPCYVPGYTCCTVCGCYDCCCDVGTTVIEYSTPSTNQNPTPANQPANQPGTEPKGEMPEKQTSVERGDAFLTVAVPDDAKVLVNGVVTQSTGDLRRYVSRNLLPGFDYTYEVKATTTVDGKPVTRTKKIQLRAGEEANLAFDPQRREAVETALTVHVPERAKVYLAGHETQGNGSIRTFRTTKLPAGQRWNDYLVRVELQDKGTVRAMEEKITLKAGEQRDLSFDFDVNKVAAVR